MNVVGFIFARGGSKGIPRKNVRLLGGKPLLAHAIDVARRSRYIQRVIVSTDDLEITAVAREFGAEVPFQRPAELATDKASEWLAWQHAIRTVNEQSPDVGMDVFVSVPATSPLRLPQDVDACVELLSESGADVVITVTEARRNPYFNMVVLDENRTARIVNASHGETIRRQDAPQVYDMTTVAYAARPEYVLSANGLWQGDVRAVFVPVERAVDIDTELDFAFAEFLLQRHQRQEPKDNR